MRLIFKGTIPRLTTMNEEGVLHCLGLCFVGHLDSLNYHVLFFLLGTMSRINGETSGFHSESFRRSIPSIGSCCVWNTNPTKNVPFVGFPVTIYFQCFWVWYCSLTLVLPLFGKESRFMQILYLVMTYTHTNHDEVPSGVCCDSFVLILMHFGLRSICCSRRWMWQVWAWLVIEAQKRLFALLRCHV